MKITNEKRYTNHPYIKAYDLTISFMFSYCCQVNGIEMGGFKLVEDDCDEKKTKHNYWICHKSAIPAFLLLYTRVSSYYFG